MLSCFAVIVCCRLGSCFRGSASSKLAPRSIVLEGCHCRDATLKLADLQRYGLTEPEAVYDVIYNGRGRMPGYGLECAPKLRCTFAKRLTDDEIRGLAAYVLEQAAADWPAPGN